MTRFKVSLGALLAAACSIQIASAACPWTSGVTDANNKLQCADGTFCVGSKDGWGCCACHGGRAKCPPNMPHMGNALACGGKTDRCCTTKKTSDPRPCPDTTPPLTRKQLKCTEPPKPACAWSDGQSTGKHDQLECMDGTKCFGWKCCKCHGGRKKCPSNYRWMSNVRTCGGGDYCCHKRKPTTKRPCPDNRPLLKACPPKCTTSADCPAASPVCLNGFCNKMSCDGGFKLDGLWKDVWKSVTPMKGRYTVMYFKYVPLSGCLCLFNDWISSTGPMCANNYNYYRFKLKGCSGWWKCTSEMWEFYLYGDQTMMIKRDNKVILARGGSSNMGKTAFSWTPNLNTKHVTYELCLPSQKGMSMKMNLADPVQKSKYKYGSCVATKPVAEPGTVVISIPGKPPWTVNPTYQQPCKVSADCPATTPICSGNALPLVDDVAFRKPHSSRGVCKAMQCGGLFKLDGLWEEAWRGVQPMKGKYTTMYFKYDPLAGCLCLFNDWVGSTGPLCADNYNYFRFFLKGCKGWWSCVKEKWEFFLYGNQEMKILRDGKTIMARGKPTNMGAAGFGITPNSDKKHTSYELCIPSSKGMSMKMNLADPVHKTKGSHKGSCVATPPVPDPDAPGVVISIGANGKYEGQVFISRPITVCSTSAECKDSAKPMCKDNICVPMSCAGGPVLDGLWDSSWAGVKPMKGVYTVMYFKYIKASGCLCMFNDWISSTGPLCASNYNYFRFTLKGGSWWKPKKETWEFKLYGDQTMEIIVNGKTVMKRGKPINMGKAGFGSTPNLATKHTSYEMCLPSETGMTMTMNLADPVSKPGKKIGKCNAEPPTPEPTVVVITIPGTGPVNPCIVKPVAPSPAAPTKPACPWLVPNPSKAFNQYVCNDGSRGFGVKFCACKGGIAQCPGNWPMMCAAKTCGGGMHCCDKTCNKYGGARPCPDIPCKTEPTGTYQSPAVPTPPGVTAAPPAPTPAPNVAMRRLVSPLPANPGIKLTFAKCGLLDLQTSSGSCTGVPYTLAGGNILLKSSSCAMQALRKEFGCGGAANTGKRRLSPAINPCSKTISLTYDGCTNSFKLTHAGGSLTATSVPTPAPAPAPAPAPTPNAGMRRLDVCSTAGKVQFGCNSDLATDYKPGYATCYATGDPHFKKTFDGSRFDFQKLGLWEIASTTDGSFLLQGFTVPYTAWAATFAGFAAKIGGQTIVLIGTRKWINGIEVTSASLPTEFCGSKVQTVSSRRRTSGVCVNVAPGASFTSTITYTGWGWKRPRNYWMNLHVEIARNLMSGAGLCAGSTSMVTAKQVTCPNSLFSTAQLKSMLKKGMKIEQACSGKAATTTTAAPPANVGFRRLAPAGDSVEACKKSGGSHADAKAACLAGGACLKKNEPMLEACIYDVCLSYVDGTDPTSGSTKATFDPAFVTSTEDACKYAEAQAKAHAANTGTIVASNPCKPSGITAKRLFDTDTTSAMGAIKSYWKPGLTVGFGLFAILIVAKVAKKLRTRRNTASFSPVGGANFVDIGDAVDDGAVE